jgi:hypothetical protein
MKADARGWFSASRVSLYLFTTGALPFAIIQFGFYSVGMCDPAPLLALIWLGLLCSAGTVFGLYAVYSTKETIRGMTIPVVATLLNLAGVFVPLWLLPM